MHDANNGYISSAAWIYKTNDGGTTWTLDMAPVSTLFETMAFAPRTVPAGITMQNRRLFVTGVNISGAPILEYGTTANVNVNTTENVINASCTNLTGGSITINATGGIAPYTYSIDAGPYQTSNTFSNLPQGPHIIQVKDAFCGLLVKTINVGFDDNLVLTASNDTAVCAGAPVQLQASTNGTGTTYVWTPAAGLNNANIANPVANVNSSTTYSVTASLNGCTKTESVNITINPNPVIDAGADKSILIGETATLNGTDNGNTQSIAWTPTATIVSAANSLNVTVKPTVTTTSTMTVVDVNN